METTEVIGAVEAGGTKFRCAIATMSGSLLETQTIPTTNPSQTLAAVVRFFRSFEPGRRLVRLGIASFGPLDLSEDSPSYGHITTTPKPGWRDVDIAGILRDAFEVEQVEIDTDVNAACLAEWLWGAGRQADVVCYVTVGTGIGAGLVVGGRPLHGLVHPEFGHIRVPHDATADPFTGCCPSHGDCLEGLASGRAIEERWQVSPRELPDGHAAWRLTTDYVALGLANLIFMVSPERLIVGGGIAGRLPIELLRERIGKLVGGYLRAPVFDAGLVDLIVRPGLGERAGLLGAVALALPDQVRAERPPSVTAQAS